MTDWADEKAIQLYPRFASKTVPEMSVTQEHIAQALREANDAGASAREKELREPMACGHERRYMGLESPSVSGECIPCKYQRELAAAEVKLKEAEAKAERLVKLSKNWRHWSEQVKLRKHPTPEMLAQAEGWKQCADEFDAALSEYKGKG